MKLKCLANILHEIFDKNSHFRVFFTDETNDSVHNLTLNGKISGYDTYFLVNSGKVYNFENEKLPGLQDGVWLLSKVLQEKIPLKIVK